MLTREKIEMYQRFGGDLDGFSRSGDASVIEQDDWSLIDELCQAIYLVKTGKAGREFAERVEERLRSHCANEETRQALRKMALS